MKELKFHRDFYNPIITGKKLSTTRIKPKDLEVGDTFKFVFVPDDTGCKPLYGNICNVEVVRFCDLDRGHAMNEGYLHEDLLKHEIMNIYPDIRPVNLVYIYEFVVENTV